MKHEEHLYSILNKGKIPGILAKILYAEFSFKPGRKRGTKRAAVAHIQENHEESNALQSVSTRAMFNSPPEKRIEASLLRVQSANEIVLLPLEEDGPKPGQKSRSITTSCGTPGTIAKKDKFYIYNDSDLDNKYRGVVDCANPVSLRKQRKKVETCPLPSFASSFKSCSYAKEEIKESCIVWAIDSNAETAKEDGSMVQFAFAEYTLSIIRQMNTLAPFRPLCVGINLPIPSKFSCTPQKQC